MQAELRKQHDKARAERAKNRSKVPPISEAGNEDDEDKGSVQTEVLDPEEPETADQADVSAPAQTTEVTQPPTEPAPEEQAPAAAADADESKPPPSEAEAPAAAVEVPPTTPVATAETSPQTAPEPAQVVEEKKEPPQPEEEVPEAAPVPAAAAATEEKKEPPQPEEEKPPEPIPATTVVAETQPTAEAPVLDTSTAPAEAPEVETDNSAVVVGPPAAEQTEEEEEQPAVDVDEEEEDDDEGAEEKPLYHFLSSTAFRAIDKSARVNSEPQGSELKKTLLRLPKAESKAVNFRNTVDYCQYVQQGAATGPFTCTLNRDANHGEIRRHKTHELVGLSHAYYPGAEMFRTYLLFKKRGEKAFVVRPIVKEGDSVYKASSGETHFTDKALAHLKEAVAKDVFTQAAAVLFHASKAEQRQYLSHVVAKGSTLRKTELEKLASSHINESRWIVADWLHADSKSDTPALEDEYPHVVHTPRKLPRTEVLYSHPDGPMYLSTEEKRVQVSWQTFRIAQNHHEGGFYLEHPSQLRTVIELPFGLIYYQDREGTPDHGWWYHTPYVRQKLPLHQLLLPGSEKARSETEFYSEFVVVLVDRDIRSRALYLAAVPRKASDQVHCPVRCVYLAPDQNLSDYTSLYQSIEDKNLSLRVRVVKPEKKSTEFKLELTHEARPGHTVNPASRFEQDAVMCIARKVVYHVLPVFRPSETEVKWRIQCGTRVITDKQSQVSVSLTVPPYLDFQRFSDEWKRTAVLPFYMATDLVEGKGVWTLTVSTANDLGWVPGRPSTDVIGTGHMEMKGSKDKFRSLNKPVAKGSSVFPSGIVKSASKFHATMMYELLLRERRFSVRDQVPWFVNVADWQRVDTKHMRRVENGLPWDRRFFAENQEALDFQRTANASMARDLNLVNYTGKPFTHRQYLDDVKAEETKRQAAEEEAKRKRAEDEAKQKAAEEARQKAEEEAKREAEAESKRKAGEEKKDAERQKQAALEQQQRLEEEDRQRKQLEEEKEKAQEAKRRAEALQKQQLDQPAPPATQGFGEEARPGTVPPPDTSMLASPATDGLVEYPAHVAAQDAKAPPATLSAVLAVTSLDLQPHKLSTDEGTKIPHYLYLLPQCKGVSYDTSKVTTPSVMKDLNKEIDASSKATLARQELANAAQHAVLTSHDQDMGFWTMYCMMHRVCAQLASGAPIRTYRLNEQKDPSKTAFQKLTRTLYGNVSYIVNVCHSVAEFNPGVVIALPMDALRLTKSAVYTRAISSALFRTNAFDDVVLSTQTSVYSSTKRSRVHVRHSFLSQAVVMRYMCQACMQVVGTELRICNTTSMEMQESFISRYCNSSTDFMGAYKQASILHDMMKGDNGKRQLTSYLEKNRLVDMSNVKEWMQRQTISLTYCVAPWTLALDPNFYEHHLFVNGFREGDITWDQLYRMSFGFLCDTTANGTSVRDAWSNCHQKAALAHGWTSFHPEGKEEWDLDWAAAHTAVFLWSRTRLVTYATLLAFMHHRVVTRRYPALMAYDEKLAELARPPMAHPPLGLVEEATMMAQASDTATIYWPDDITVPLTLGSDTTSTDTPYTFAESKAGGSITVTKQQNGDLRLIIPRYFATQTSGRIDDRSTMVTSKLPISPSNPYLLYPMFSELVDLISSVFWLAKHDPDCAQYELNYRGVPCVVEKDIET